MGPILGVKEFFVDVDAEESKLQTLCNLFDKLPMKQAIVFCNTVPKVEWLTRRMREKNLYVSAVVIKNISKQNRILNQRSKYFFL